MSTPLPTSTHNRDSAERRAGARRSLRTLRPGRRSAVLAASFATTVGGMLAFAPGAFASFFSITEGVSPNAQATHTLYLVTLVIALIITVAVLAGFSYAVVKYRARPGAVARQIHGNTKLEMTWTLGAALVLVGLAVFTFIKLSSIQNPPDSGPNGAKVGESGSVGESGTLFASANRRVPPNHKSLNITVIGRQYIWQYIYPDANEPDGLGAVYTYDQMVVPTNTTVTLDIVSDDVVHAWWIPALGGKFQADPGLHNYTWFKISKPGVYPGQCAYLCGRGHARMIASVKAVPPAQFEEWLANQKQELYEADQKVKATREELSAKEGGAKVSLEE